MRLFDVFLRAGHLSERAVIAAVASGKRPAHLDRCLICADRASELGLWLCSLRALGDEAVDVALSGEGQRAQKQRILRRLEQLDRPVRVITFPNQGKFPRKVRRRVAFGWLGVSAVAGLVMGVATSYSTARLSTRPPGLSTTAAPYERATLALPEISDGASDTYPSDRTVTDTDTNSPELLEEIDRLVVPAFEAMASMTPRVFAATPVTLRASAIR